MKRKTVKDLKKWRVLISVHGAKLFEGYAKDEDAAVKAYYAGKFDLVKDDSGEFAIEEFDEIK